MPTSNPRVNVTLSQSLDLLVSRMAGHQRISKSQVLRELLQAAEPALQKAVALMDAASAATAEVRNGLARDLQRDTAKAEKAAAALLAGMDQTTSDLVAVAEAVKERRPARGRRAAHGPGGAPDASDPPSSNRGVNKSSRRKGGAS